MDAERFIKEFQDHLAPKLDTYEQAIYLYAFRHSRLLGKDEVVIGFKSARKKLAFGIGQRGTALSEGVCYEKLRSLQSKGFLEVLGTERAGTRIKLRLPEEVPGLIPVPTPAAAPQDLEKMDFFKEPHLRLALLERESNKCFYCLRRIDEKNYVIEHVVSRPNGSNSYKNLVAACRQCNNRKSDASASDFLRVLLREGLLNDSEFSGRLAAVEQLHAGQLKPEIKAG